MSNAYSGGCTEWYPFEMGAENTVNGVHIKISPRLTPSSVEIGSFQVSFFLATSLKQQRMMEMCDMTSLWCVHLVGFGRKRKLYQGHQVIAAL